MSARIPTYFSHSYWPEDREVNKHFWKLFWDAGFAFTVDPRSGTLSIPHIESLVRRTACFVGVVTHRPEVDHYQASPYLVFEYGLAVQAGKPRLVFVERSAARHHYGEGERLVFDRGAIANDRQRHLAAIRQLHEMSAGHARMGDRERGSVGILLPHDGAYRRAMPAIREVLASAGYEVVAIDYDMPNPYRFIAEVDRHDFLLIDVDNDELPSWLHPVLYGHFVPMVRLLHYETGTGPVRSLPRLLLGHAIELVARGDELALWWSSVDELLPKLEREVRALKLPPRGEFHTLEQGMGYFNSLGRSVDATVFVSNANSENDVAQELCGLLRTNYVRFFHYIFENTIELGSPWPDGLRDRLRSSQLFVPLITSAYWESDVCREEYRIAEELRRQGRIRILPYFLDPGDPAVPLQGRALHRIPPDQWPDRIMLDIDGYLTPRTVAPELSSRWWCDETEPQVDVALVTVLPEEYDAVIRHLDRSDPVPSIETRPNRYAWRFGEIAPADGGRPYRVVVALAGEKGTNAGLLVVGHTIEAFRPRYVLLVGIAGGLGEPCPGDVVVANRIYGYEYGKVEDGFHPRPEWNHPTDTAVVNAALTMPGLHPDWSRGVIRDIATPPRVFVGPIASGNKIVDDISDPSFRPVLDAWPELVAVEMEGIGAAEVIKDARERGHVVNFGMVRGVSDKPNGRRAKQTGRPGSGGTRERDRWKVAAADAAAALTVQMIRRAWSRPPRR